MEDFVTEDEKRRRLVPMYYLRRKLNSGPIPVANRDGMVPLYPTMRAARQVAYDAHLREEYLICDILVPKEWYVSAATVAVHPHMIVTDGYPHTLSNLAGGEWNITYPPTVKPKPKLLPKRIVKLRRRK